ncbi:MAG: type II toxin-antitoxin system VapC family toxin [Propionibacteriaceae bacterium]|nr:type II toxin-antitoxin system VapC family toxin [Propionibacteriaceae bacterium]
MRYLLDTNTVSHLIRASPVALAHLSEIGASRVLISAITVAEIRYGLAKNPNATRLRRAVDELLAHITVADFTATTAMTYGALRARLETTGMPMSPLDTLIAATALASDDNPTDVVLVTNDHAFTRVAGLTVEDWTK